MQFRELLYRKACAYFVYWSKLRFILTNLFWWTSVAWIIRAIISVVCFKGRLRLVLFNKSGKIKTQTSTWRSVGCRMRSVSDATRPIWALAKILLLQGCICRVVNRLWISNSHLNLSNEPKKSTSVFVQSGAIANPAMQASRWNV